MRARTSRCLAGLLAVAALGALPSSAAAQSAGDEQYADPFRDEPQRQQQPQQQQQQQGSESGSQSDAPAGGSQQSGTTTSQAQSGDAQQVAEPGLPRTGLPAGLLAGSGLALLASGAALRRRF